VCILHPQPQVVLLAAALDINRGVNAACHRAATLLQAGLACFSTALENCQRRKTSSLIWLVTLAIVCHAQWTLDFSGVNYHAHFADLKRVFIMASSVVHISGL